MVAEHVQLTQEWLRYAREDIEGAEALLSIPPRAVPRHSCFLSQQSAEKALKAALIFLQIDYPRTHNLALLRDLIPTGWQVKTAFPDLQSLTEWAVEARYFSEMPDPTPDDARAATTQARSMYEIVFADLVAHGFTP